MVVQLIECRVYGRQYNDCTVIKFRARTNNYKSTHRNFRKERIMSNQACNQKRFHEYYLQNDHNRICDWEITIIDHAKTVKSLSQKALYWYYKLNTYAPFGLNEGDVYDAYQTRQSFHSLDAFVLCFCFFFFFSYFLFVSFLFPCKCFVC